MPIPEWVNYLPFWAKYDEFMGQVVCDPGVVYPEITRLMASIDPEQYANVALTQEILEDARHVATRIVLKIMRRFEKKEALHIRFTRNNQWRLSNFPTSASLAVMPPNRFRLIYRVLEIDKI